MEQQFEQHSNKKTVIIVLIILILIGTIISMLYLTYKDKQEKKKNETNSSLIENYVNLSLMAFDRENNEISVNYELLLDNEILVNGSIERGILETYRSISPNITMIDCGDDILKRENNRFICEKETRLMDLCKDEGFLFEQGECFKNEYNISLCPDITKSTDLTNTKCYINMSYLCNGTMTNDTCLSEIKPISKKAIYFRAFSDLYYEAETECVLESSFCDITLDRKPELNISIDGDVMTIINENNGLIRNDTLICFSWTSDITTFNIDSLEKADMPEDYRFFYDKCYHINADNLTFAMNMVRSGNANLKVLLLGDFAKDNKNLTFVETFI